jgi:predicted nucleic acid-binding protein
MARVYLETSFFSACVSARTSPKSVAWRDTSLEWWQTQAARHEIHVSDEVVAELSHPDFAQGSAALEMLRGLRLLELAPEVRGLARILIREKVMPNPAVSGDAIHIAAATVHGMDYVLTWNVQHMANPNKRTHFVTLCLRLGLLPPQIVTPDLLMEADE